MDNNYDNTFPKQIWQEIGRVKDKEVAEQLAIFCLSIVKSGFDQKAFSGSMKLAHAHC